MPRENKRKKPSLTVQITLSIISEERDRMTVGRYKNGD